MNLQIISVFCCTDPWRYDRKLQHGTQSCLFQFRGPPFDNLIKIILIWSFPVNALGLKFFSRFQTCGDFFIYSHDNELIWLLLKTIPEINYGFLKDSQGARSLSIGSGTLAVPKKREKNLISLLLIKQILLLHNLLQHQKLPKSTKSISWEVLAVH